MSTSTAVPLEEYLRTTYDPDMEYVDGQLVDRHVGKYLHSRLLALIAFALGARERVRRFRVFIEQRVRVREQACYRIPDICVKAPPHATTPILELPDLAIEVISPDDEIGEMLTKAGDYLASGVPHIWLVDPYKRTLIEVDRDGIRRPASTVLSTALVGDIDFAALFAQLDEPAA